MRSPIFLQCTNLFYGATGPCEPGSHCRGFMITPSHTTPGRTRLDEWWARRRDLYPPTRNIHKEEISMSPGGIRNRNPKTRAAADPQVSAYKCILQLVHWLNLRCHYSLIKVLPRHVKNVNYNYNYVCRCWSCFVRLGMASSQPHHLYNYPDVAGIYYIFSRKDEGFIFDRHLAVYTASSRIFYVKAYLAFYAVLNLHCSVFITYTTTRLYLQ